MSAMMHSSVKVTCASSDHMSTNQPKNGGNPAMRYGILFVTALFLLLPEAFASDCEGVTITVTTSGAGGSTSDPTDPQPLDPVNLKNDTDILGVDGNELYAGHDQFLPGMKARNRVAVKAVGGDAGNWKTRDNADTIDIKYLVSIDDGEWVQWQTGYITIAKLDEGETITETKDYIIPDGISSIAFRTEIDFRNEVEEYDEGDNKSRVERYEVTSLRPDLTVTDVYFSDAITGARYYNGATLLEDNYWHPYCEMTNLGEIDSPLQVKVSHRMDGSERDEDFLDPGESRVGEIATEVVWDSWKLGNTGDRTYTCCVDSKGWLPELNEANNCKSATYHVVPWKADLIVSDLYLKVNGWVIRQGGFIRKDSYVNPYCEVQNVGNRDAPNGFRIDYQINQGNRRGDDGVDAGDMRVGAKKMEYISNSFRLGDTGTRTYQCYADYQGNLHESNEGNNAQTMGFTVTNFPTSPDGTFVWSYAGPVSGAYCTQISEGADPHTWMDNYFCATQDYGMRWNSAGSIGGMRCTQIRESADPHTWNDNYLCVPPSSPLNFSWSSAGPIGGKRCVQWLEPSDPHTWNDNYLCY